MRGRFVAATVAVVLGVVGAAAASVASPRAVPIKTGPGINTSKKEIHVSALLPLTGPQAGPQILPGMDAHFRYINARGGINGYKIRWGAQDTQFRPDVAIQAYQKVKDRTAMFAIVLGTPTVAALLPQIKTDGVTAVPISNAAAWLHEPNLAPSQGTYQQQIIALMEYAATARGLRNRTWCALKQNDAFGAQFDEGAQYAAKRLGITIKTTPTFSLTDTDLTAQVSTLKNNGCDVVIHEGVTGGSLRAATAAQQLNFKPQWLLSSVAYLASYPESALGTYIQRQWLIGAYGAAWNDNTVPGQVKLRASLKRYERNPPPNIITQWGWTNAMVTVQILRRAMANRDLSRAGILRALSQIETLQFEGILPPMPYGGSAEKRKPSPAVDILRVRLGVATGLLAVKRKYVSPAARAYVNGVQ